MGYRNDFQPFRDFSRYFLYVFSISFRYKNRLHPCIFCSKQLFFQAPDWKHSATQRDFSCHGQICPHFSSGHCRNHGCCHCDSGRRSVFWHCPLWNMNVDIVFFKEIIIHLILSAHRTDITDSGLCRLFHHIPKLSGQHDLSYSRHHIDFNLQGISSLVKGMSYEQIKAKLDGIRCGYKSTSCPDQLVRAIEEAMADK